MRCPGVFLCWFFPCREADPRQPHILLGLAQTCWRQSLKTYLQTFFSCFIFSGSIVGSPEVVSSSTNSGKFLIHI